MMDGVVRSIPNNPRGGGGSVMGKTLEIRRSGV